MSGEDIRALQTKLKSLNYPLGDLDGIFGTKTHQSVVSYQKDKKLKDDGIVGSATWSSLGGVYKASSNQTSGATSTSNVSKYKLTRILKYLSPCMTGNDVKELQKVLAKYTTSVGKIDGIFGSKTRDAVKFVQRKLKIKDDGIVGQKTCEAIGWQWK
ncbi:peptidoglycan-binding protein [Christensenellaceae bacterium OttesenSCG-928-K19]|nr:peptidoglycan-binding protein [Christensenellaceae bacterium OttesenSCG-928-K19]